MFTPQGFVPESSAKWLVDEIAKEAELQDSPLSDWDLRVLASPITDFQDNQRHLVEATHNLCVNLARSAIERAKDRGLRTLQVRDGLVIPEIWEDHYETVYESNFPWLVSLVMQNAFLGNPLVGETGPWNSPEGSVQIKEITRPISAPVTATALKSDSNSGLTETEKNQAGIAALIFGIASAFLFEIWLIPVVAVIVGGIGLSRASQLKDMGVEKRGFGFSLTGLILGIVYTLTSFVYMTELV